MVMWPLLLRPDPRFLVSRSFSTGRPLCSSGLTTLTSPRRPGDVGLTFIRAISGFLREVDFLPRLEAHICLLPVTAASAVCTEALGLSFDVGDLHALHLDLEQELDRGLDLGLGGILGNPEHDLRVLVGDERRLFRNGRREQQREKPLRVVLAWDNCRLLRAHARISSNCATAALVRSTWSKRTRLTGST